MYSAVTISDGQVSGVDSLSAASSSVVNWEVDEAGINRPRPALVAYTLSNFTTSEIIGLEKWGNYVIAVTEDRKLWAINDALPNFAQALSGSTAATQLEGTKRPVFAMGESYIYVAGGGRIQRWGTSILLSELLSNSPNCTHIATIGQRLVANDITSPQEYQWSSIGEGAWNTWPSANASNADARPDAVVAIYENINELFVFGETTLQVYQVGSDPTLPFDKVSTINTGLISPYLAIRLDEAFAFFDDKRRIVISDGRTAEDISGAIQKDLRGLETISDAWGYREEIGQHSRLVFRFPTERRTFVYDLKGKRWFGERKYYAAPLSADWPVTAYAYRPKDNRHLVGLSTSAAGMAELDPDIREDLSGPLVCERTTGWHDHASKKHKRSRCVQVTMRRGTAAEGTTPGALEVRVQDDESPWSPWEPVSVGEPEEYEQTVELYLGGIFKRRRYGLRYSTSEDTSLAAVDDDVEELPI